MDLHKIDQVIAERRYSLLSKSGASKEIVVRLGVPNQSPDHADFFCPFEIVGLGAKEIKCGFGVDAFQALQLTLKMIGADLHYHRQRYGQGFYFVEEGDDLGFPEEAWAEDLGLRIARAFAPLYGLKLSISRNAASMKNFQFGTIMPHPTGKGTVGQYALHIQCPWRIVTARDPWRIPTTDPMVTGSGDWWEPSEKTDSFDWDDWNEYRAIPSLQEKLLQSLFQHYDSETKSYINISDRLVVENVEADDCGGLDIHLSGSFRLQVFPAGHSGEHWRFFSPGSEEPHLVMAEGKLTQK
jgi:hypothetical protein